MQIRALQSGDADAIERLFISVFTESEGQQEGALIGRLASDLMSHTDGGDLYGFVAVDEQQIVGAILLSRLTFPGRREVFVLAPVAIGIHHQGRGIGKALIWHGLQRMKEAGAEYVTTYGDPAFYSKVGFRPISQDRIKAPYALSQPEGWLGQSLTGEIIDTIPGQCTCVNALDDVRFW